MKDNFSTLAPSYTLGPVYVRWASPVSRADRLYISRRAGPLADKYAVKNVFTMFAKPTRQWLHGTELCPYWTKLPFNSHLFVERFQRKTLLKVDQNETTYISYECGRSKTVEKRIKMKTMTKISQMRVFIDPFVACACNSIVFERFIRKRITTLLWTRIDRCAFDDNENAYSAFESVDRASNW